MSTFPRPATPPIAGPAKAMACDDDPMLTEADVARRYNVTVSCVRAWRWRRQGPPYVKVNTLVRYRLSDIRAYDRTRTVYPDRAGDL